jgi:hypothetical protein
MVELSAATKQHITTLFAPADVREAEALLAQECADNLPLVGDPTPVGLERLRFAALRLSGGRLEGLRDAVALAQGDWRDLLMAAEFGYDTRAHEKWQPRPFGPDVVARWRAGDLPEGVKFGFGTMVRNHLTVRPAILHLMPEHLRRRARTGTVIALLAIEPEPRYLVVYDAAEQIKEYQRNLVAVPQGPPTV